MRPRLTVKSSHNAVWGHWFIVLQKVNTIPKYGRYLRIKFPLREALEEIASGVLEYAGLNNEHAGDICLNYFHKIKLKYVVGVRKRSLLGWTWIEVNWTWIFVKYWRQQEQLGTTWGPQADFWWWTAISMNNQQLSKKYFPSTSQVLHSSKSLS